ncbi:MAG: hypothetical protein U1E73_06190 [Planctomycetota bacterium]
MIGVARGRYPAIGCIQAALPHRALPDRRGDAEPVCAGSIRRTSRRGSRTLLALQNEMPWLCHAAGLAHPAQATLGHFELLDDRFLAGQRAVFDYPQDNLDTRRGDDAPSSRRSYTRPSHRRSHHVQPSSWSSRSGSPDCASGSHRTRHFYQCCSSPACRC